MAGKQRLDQIIVQRGLVATRSQAENYIKLGYVLVDGKSIIKAGQPVDGKSQIKLLLKEQYVSRAALKLASVAEKIKLNFKDKTVLDVGSSTGGFTDYALRHGAKKVIAVDVGSNQLHPSLRDNPKVNLHEHTDIRNFKPKVSPDIVLIDVSFISLRQILPHIADMSSKKTQIVAMLKPQFEAGKDALNKGVVKNDKLRRQILRNFELWSKKLFVVRDKADSSISGVRGNIERFYLLIKQ
ncbi:TlyA family RNA methyltransferase [Candidatus Saccharibacteria bacterium]|nr:TlyA family RNA methyltransferase [Candidatus Saccharibacteria bacterium]